MRITTPLLAAFVLVASVARAETFASTGGLDAITSASLQTSITRARTRDPGAFDAVRGIVAHADELDHQRRGRFFPMTPLLRGTLRGHAGSAMALLEPLVSPERFAMPKSDSARIALRAGLIEAAGDAKDPSAAPVFRSIVAHGTEFYEVRAATEALGKLALDADVATLAHLATTPSATRDAVVAGLGMCRRATAAHALESLVAQHPTGMSAVRLLRSLATMGSAWGLATPNAAPALEAPVIRDVTAHAALAMFAQTTEPELRADATTTLLEIDAPDAPRWIEAMKPSASPELASALGALETRLAHNPTRTTTRSP
jgi:hypothetical protein